MTTTTDPVTIPGLDRLDWAELELRLDADGFAITPPLLTAEQCAGTRELFDADELFRSTIVMARHAFGDGRYRYFADPLPPQVQALRTQLYPPIARVANTWAERLNERTYPTPSTACSTSAPRRGRRNRPRSSCATALPATTACTRTSTATSRSRCSSWSCSASPTSTSPAGRACSSNSARVSSRAPWSRARARARP